jgi:hypothetical protein
MKKLHWIKITIGNMDEISFVTILSDLFSKDNSPDDSVYIDRDLIEFDGPDYIKEIADSENFFIALKIDVLDLDERKILARISQSVISNQLVVIINGLEINSEEWGKVKSITISLLSSIKDFMGKIISVDIDDLTTAERSSLEELTEKQFENRNLIPQDVVKPWENIVDLKENDKTIIIMWNETKERVQEISRKVQLNPNTVQNRISILRSEYGTGVVPYKNDRGSKKRSIE